MTARKIQGKWYVDFRFHHAGGRVERVRKLSPVPSRAGAQEYERQVRAVMLSPPPEQKEVPAFATFADEFMKTYAAANNKPSEQAAKRSILKHHLFPAFVGRRLDEIKAHDIERLKAALLARGSSRKRVNNVLACLGKILRYAHEVEALAVVPKIKLLKLAPQRFDFLTFEEYARLLDPMRGDPARLAMLTVAGDAGLRKGEILALEWGDIDFAARTLTVRRSEWEGIVGAPKSGRDRKLPMTERLAAALRACRHLRGERVFVDASGGRITPGAMEAALRYACKRAGLRQIGWHVLRHSFCSHLAMRCAAPKAIQELAGHATMTMTLRYMHLAPGALREAIQLLEGPQLGNAAGTVPQATGTA